MKNIFFIAAIAMLLTSCGRFANEDKKGAMDVRIVSASKQYTEIMYALNADSNLVAVDLSSTYPPEAKDLPTIGYHMKLSFEGIMSVKPTLLLHSGGNYSIGPETVVSQLEKLRIPMKTFETKAEDIPGTTALIREMGQYFHKEQKAEVLCEKLEADMQKALENGKTYTDTVKVIVIHFGRASNSYLIRGNEDVAGEMVRWAGGIIPIDKKGMARITSPEIIAQANPDVILLTDFGYDRLGSMEKVLELPGVALTNAAKTGRIYRVEGHDLIYLGPRTGENVLKLQKLIHQTQ
ncbi:MAG: ABC transporter substrate-binding protein [Saprospiraceae bacterium]|nr:ABC transporter substrate-binding protein [Saprospiraceae bacterium]